MRGRKDVLMFLSSFLSFFLMYYSIMAAKSCEVCLGTHIFAHFLFHNSYNSVTLDGDSL